MTNPRPYVVLLTVLGALAVRGEETGAPLEASGRAIRNLEKEQQVQTGPTTTEGLRKEVPGFSQSLPELKPDWQISRERRELGKQQQKEDRQKNWLINGVNQLGQDTKRKDRSSSLIGENSDSVDESETLDSSDLDYLLKVYDEQRKGEEARKATELKTQRTTLTDPFAPFLQDWLGNSPVSGKFFDEFVNNPEGNRQGLASSGSIGVPLQGPIGMPASANPGVASPVPTPNPYLVEMNSNRLPGQVGGEGTSTTTGIYTGESSVITTDKPLSSQIMTPAEPKPTELSRKPLLPALSDDKKYFPQLKKF